MKKSAPVVLTIAVSVLFFMALFFLGYYDGVKVYSPEEGPLVLEDGKVAALTGPWQFSWDTFTSSYDPENADAEIRMPYHWHIPFGGRGFPVHGYATYAFRLETSGMRGNNALYIPPVGSAYRMLINGRLVAEHGTPSASAAGEATRGRAAVYYFEQTADTLDIVLQVSNHTTYLGGILQGRPEYGREGDVQARHAMLLLGDAFLFVLLLFIGIVSLFWYLYNRQEVHNAVFAFISLLFAFRVLLTGVGLVYIIFPFFHVKGVGLSLIITYLWSLPFFLAYFRHSFPDEFPLWIPLSALFAAVVFTVITFVLDSGLYPQMVAAYGGLVALGGLYSFARLITAIRRGRRNAKLLLLSAVIVVGCGLNDILHTSGLIQSVLLMNAGIGVFGLLQVLILGVSSRTTFRELYDVHQRLRIMHSLQEIFFSTAATQLHKPLKGIRDITDSLLRGSLGPITSDQLGSLSLINAGALQLSNLVADILDFRRIREGNVEVSRRPVNLFVLVERVKAAVSLSFHEKALSFHNEVSRDIENLYADEGLLERALFNIARGFAEYAQSGALTVSAETAEDEIKIRLAWEAEDLDREKILHAFTMFDEHQDRDDEEVSTRSGLALSIARRIIEIQGGTFTLDPESDKTLEITLVLQRILPEGDQESAQEEAAHLDALINLEPVLDEVVLTRNIDIMIVSSDLMEIQVMKSQLASMNYNVIPATSGGAAIQKIEEKAPNLVLLDVALNDMSGYDVSGKIREHWSSSELPIILVTEKEKVSNLMEGLTSGANDFLARPYHMEEFLTRVNTHIQLARINQMYSRFVPTEFLNTLGQENIIDLKLGDQVQREMTVLFVDIRAFTNLSENMTPQENFKFINSYLSRFSPMITRNNGFVDKFIGDAIMALYPGPPEDAIQTALEMVEHVTIYNGHRAKCGYNPINIGIGIHTGNLILGIIGDDQRMQGTVISDAVNLASRIQDVTKLYHTSIVISQETFVKLENPMSYDFRFLGKVKVKGKAKSVSLFEIFNGDGDEQRALKAETKNDFETAIILFAKRRFEEASVILEDIAEKNPQDYATRLFLDRAKKFLAAEKRAFLSSL